MTAELVAASQALNAAAEKSEAAASKLDAAADKIERALGGGPSLGSPHVDK
jgi:hypothetical protein